MKAESGQTVEAFVPADDPSIQQLLASGTLSEVPELTQLQWSSIDANATSFALMAPNSASRISRRNIAFMNMINDALDEK